MGKADGNSYLGDDTVEVNSSTLDGRLRSNSSSSQIPPHSSSQARKVTENTNVIEEEPSPAYLRTMIQKNFGPDYRDVTLEEPLRPDAVQQLVSRLQQTSGYRQEPGIGVLLTATLHSSLDPDVQRTILDMLRILLSPEWRGSILNHIMHQDYVDQDLVCYSVSCLIKGGASPDELDEKGMILHTRFGFIRQQAAHRPQGSRHYIERYGGETMISPNCSWKTAQM